MRIAPTLALTFGLAATGIALAVAGEPPAGPAPAAPSAERGYRFITEKAYVPASFEQRSFDAVWEVWPEPLRARAEKATPIERRRMAYERYGLTSRPGDDSGKPLQYVVDEKGRFTINCFACHGGQVAGRVIPGLPNAHVALQDLVDDVARLEVARGIRPQLGGSMLSRVPLGETHGTTNAVMFSVALLAFRDADLNVVLPKSRPKFVHHDLDAPPWWHLHRKSRLYLDGLVGKGHRSLMQFLLVPTNGPARLAEWEPDFRDILAYIESVRPPAYPFAIDRALAARGEGVFRASCASCHGTYGEKPAYPEVMVPIDVIATDRLRHDAVDPTQRALFADSWFTEHDRKKATTNPTGYVAPPLDGIWASAPYFHNGSVPTLWHVLHPDARPKAWRVVAAEGYDEKRVGLDVEAKDAVPAGLSAPSDPSTPADPWERRAWFDTTKPGKGAAGHLFPAAIPEADRAALLEYLKTL